MVVPSTSVARCRLAVSRLVVVFFLSLLALLVTTGRLYAGTITITDGVHDPPNGIFSDDEIAAQLQTGPVTLDTSDIGTGPDDILIEEGVEIIWASEFTLTLIAQNQIVVSGTIQHDGPEDGRGGVELLAEGDVTLGLGEQPDSIAVGSRHGLTRVDGDNVTLRAGDVSVDFRFVQLGFRAMMNQGANYTVTGPISVTAKGDVSLLAGGNDTNYAQIGHGGGDFDLEIGVDGTFSGDITIVAGGNIRATGGDGDRAYVQVGSGGTDISGDFSGNHTLTAGQGISFTAGSGLDAYAQVGNGGYAANGNHSGDHRLTAESGNIAFRGSSGELAYVQVGNGGPFVIGDYRGSHTLTAPFGDIVFEGGGVDAYAQVGNGGVFAEGDHRGNHTLTAGHSISFTAGSGERAYAQVGNGGYLPKPRRMVTAATTRSTPG